LVGDEWSRVVTVGLDWMFTRNVIEAQTAAVRQLLQPLSQTSYLLSHEGED
jgi:hypothetical protein